MAIAYVMHKAPFVFPIIGGRKVEHLLQNIEAIEISLSDEQIAYLESVVPFEPGFPNFMIVRLESGFGVGYWNSNRAFRRVTERRFLGCFYRLPKSISCHPRGHTLLQKWPLNELGRYCGRSRWSVSPVMYFAPCSDNL